MTKLAADNLSCGSRGLLSARAQLPGVFGWRGEGQGLRESVTSFQLFDLRSYVYYFNIILIVSHSNVILICSGIVIFAIYQH